MYLKFTFQYANLTFANDNSTSPCFSQKGKCALSLALEPDISTTASFPTVSLFTIITKLSLNISHTFSLNMAITLMEELAFRLQQLIFFYMWPFPLKLDFKKDLLCLNKPCVKWIPFAATVIYIFIYGWVCLATTVYFTYINPRTDFLRVNVAFVL